MSSPSNRSALPDVIDGVKVSSHRHADGKPFSVSTVQHLPTAVVLSLFDPDDRPDHATFYGAVDADSLQIRIMQTELHGSFLAIDWKHLGRYPVTVNLLGITLEQVLAAIDPTGAGA